VVGGSLVVAARFDGWVLVVGWSPVAGSVLQFVLATHSLLVARGCCLVGGGCWRAGEACLLVAVGWWVIAVCLLSLFMLGMALQVTSFISLHFAKCFL
jgi:hypothetical protein